MVSRLCRGLIGLSGILVIACSSVIKDQSTAVRHGDTGAIEIPTPLALVRAKIFRLSDAGAFRDEHTGLTLSATEVQINAIQPLENASAVGGEFLDIIEILPSIFDDPHAPELASYQYREYLRSLEFLARQYASTRDCEIRQVGHELMSYVQRVFPSRYQEDISRYQVLKFMAIMQSTEPCS